MTTFLDGPAAGQRLQLKRSPEWLRVVRGPRGWDALDQHSDRPAPDEQLYVYRVARRLGSAHYRMRTGGGFYPITSYRLVDPQPDDATLREGPAWRAWLAVQP